MGSLVLLDLMGGVALLLWGLHMVHSGILRAFGPDLRRLLAKALDNRFAAFAAGLGLTALLQSSTATALITSSFAAEGLVSLVPALAIMLGANVGTTLIVQVLSFNIAAVAPVLFVLGLVAFRSGARSRIKDVGRVSIGLGLMLLALHILLDTLAPAENAPGVRVLHERDHRRSRAVHRHRRCRHLGRAFERRQRAADHVAGLFAFHHAFCGAGARARRQSRQRHQPAVRRRAPRQSRELSPAGRQPASTGWSACCWSLPFLHPIADGIAGLATRPRQDDRRIPHRLQCRDRDPLHRPARRHGAAAEQAAAESRPWKPIRRGRAISTRPRWKRPRSRWPTPRAKRCIWAIIVEVMLRKVMAAMMTNDRSLVDQVSRMDNSVDSLDEAIKLYVTKLTRGSLDEHEGRRAMEIISFTINLEHIGDIIDKNLSELATKKIKRRFQFSPEGAEELSAFHKRTMDSLRIAFGVFMSGDVNEARKLLAEKAALRNAELAATERHLDRLREGRPETIETTSLHLDVLRDLRRIHSHICSVAYPVLDAAGELPAVEAPRAILATLAAHPAHAIRCGAGRRHQDSVARATPAVR